MRTLRSLELILDSGQKYYVEFGIPDNEFEINEMFRLRYRRYVEKGYIKPNSSCLDIDEYDTEQKCRYLIARINDKIVGSVRFIISDPLPTESLCFSFDEPVEMGAIPRDMRGEVSRLVSESQGKVSEHLIVIGLIACLHELAEDNYILGGYIYVKESLFRILRFLGIPLAPIEDAVLVYPENEYMHGYFYESTDRVIPAVYLRDGVGESINIILANGSKTGTQKKWARIGQANDRISA